MLRAAEDHLKLCAARPSPGVRCRGYALMVSAMSDGPEPIPLSLQRRLLTVATADADDTDPKLATSALELLCWITAGETAPQNIRRDAETRAGDGEECRSDWLACVRDADPAEQDRLCAAVLGALQRPERERRLTGLFLLAEQRSPWVFEAQVGRALSLVSDCVQSANADTTAVTTAIKSEHIQLIYAMGALSRLVEQFPEACARLEESVLSAVLDRGLLSRVERVRSAALQLLGGLCSARDSAVVSSFVKTNTLRVMNWINTWLAESEEKHSPLPPASGGMAAGGGDDAISEAGAVWRAWVALVSPGALPPLLKSGSAGPQSAGFMLKSVEKMFGCVGPDMSWARLQGTRCWQTIVDSIVEIEEWWENQAKIVKLLLRCIVHVLEAEQDDADVVISIGSCLETLLGRAWPNVDLLLSMSLNSSGSVSVRKTLTGLLVLLTTPTADKKITNIEKKVQCAKFAVGVKCLYLSYASCIGKTPCRVLSAFSARMECDTDSAGIDLLIDVLEGINLATHQLSQAHVLMVASGDLLPECRVVLEDTLTRLVMTFQKALMTICQGLVQSRGYQPKKHQDRDMRSPSTSRINHAASPGDLSLGSHIIYTMDSDGFEHPVLSSASPSVVEVVDRLFHIIVQSFDSHWNSDFGDLHANLREFIVESFWWLLHRLSAYDISPGQSDMQLLLAAVQPLHLIPEKTTDGSVHILSADESTVGSCCFNEVGEVPAVMLGMALLLSVAHASRINASGSAAHVSVLCAAIRRSMKSITESRTLPVAFRWLPWLTRRLLNIKQLSATVTAVREEDILGSNSWSSNCALDIVGAFATAAASELSKMPVTDSSAGSVESAETSALLCNMMAGLLNLLAVPLYVMVFRPQSMHAFFLPGSDNYEMDMVNADAVAQSWGKLVDTILQYGDEHVAGLMHLVKQVTSGEALLPAQCGDPADVLGGVRLSCRMLSVLLSSVTRSAVAQKEPSSRILLLKELKQIILNLFAVWVLPAWSSAVSSVVEMAVCTDQLDTVVTFMRLAFGADLSQMFARSTFWIDSSLRFGPKIGDLSQALELILGCVSRSLEALTSVNVDTANEDTTTVGLVKLALDAVYIFVQSFVTELSRLKSGVTSESIGGNFMTFTEILRDFQARFIKSSLTSKGELAYLSLGELIRELGIFNGDAETIAPSSSRFFVVGPGAKRSFISDTSAASNSPPLPKKAKLLSAEPVEYVSVASSVSSNDQLVRLRPRQWGGIPATYSRLDRDNLQSQSQEHSHSSQIACGANIYGDLGPEARGCIHCAVNRLLYCLSTVHQMSDQDMATVSPHACLCMEQSAGVLALLNASSSSTSHLQCTCCRKDSTAAGEDCRGAGLADSIRAAVADILAFLPS